MLLMNTRLVIIKSRYAAIWAALFTCIFSGCGRSGQGKVTGTLLHRDGTPLVNANVIARCNETGKSVHAGTDQEGNFAMGAADLGDGVLPGNYAVGIVEDRGDSDHRRRPTIAAKYFDPAKSGISVNVAAGESKVLNLTLDSP